MLAKILLDDDCEQEATAIMSQPRPNDNTLGDAYDRIGTAPYNSNNNGGSLHVSLDNYLNDEEAVQEAGSKHLSEPYPVQEARLARMQQDVQYRQAIYNQDPTEENSAEVKSAKDAISRAAADGLIASQSNDGFPPGWTFSG